MTEHIQLKIEISHDVRNDKDVKEMQIRVLMALNHPNDQALDVRISCGNRASAVYVTLISKRWQSKDVTYIPKKVALTLEKENYAKNTSVKDWQIEAVTVHKSVE